MHAPPKAVRAQRALRRLALLLLATVLSLGARAERADDAARADDDQPAILTLVVNGEAKGEVTVVLRGRDVLIARDDLRRAGVTPPAGRSARVLDREGVSLDSLSPPLRYAFDERALSLRIDAPARLLQTSTIDLSESAPAGIEQGRDTSAWLNYSVRLSDLVHPDGAVEAGLSVDGQLLATTSAAVSEQHGVVRGMSSVTVDDRATLRRWVAGDTFISGGALGGGLYTAGLSVARTFSLDPYFIAAPSLGTTGSALTQSTLEVYLNGVLVKRQAIPPGPFEVRNIRPVTGSGEVRYVVRDGFGRQQAAATPYYVASSALARGLSEYTYAIGARREDIGTKSFSYGALGLLAHHRYGFSDALTAGARFEAGAGVVSGGPAVTVVLPFGQLDLEVGASAAAAGMGGAALAAYSYSSGRFSGGLAAQAATARYATLSLAPGEPRERLRLGGFTSVAVGSRATVGARYDLTLDDALRLWTRVALSTNVQLTKTLALAVNVGRATADDGGAPFDVTFGLSGTLGERTSVSTGARVGPETREIYADVSRPQPQSTGVGYRVHGVAGASPQASAGVQAQAPYGRYQATLDVTPAGPHLLVEATGAVAAMRGAGVMALRPVQDGFAVIRVPGVPGVVGYLNNQEVGRTDADGNLVVPDLLAYYGNRLSIADRDLPLDHTVAGIERTLAPPFRGGVLAQFESRQARFFRGQVAVIERAGRVIPSYGEIAVSAAGKEVSSPLGKDGEFELMDLEPGLHRAVITYAGGTCSFQLGVPESSRAVADLGERRCVALHP